MAVGVSSHQAKAARPASGAFPHNDNGKPAPGAAPPVLPPGHAVSRDEAARAGASSSLLESMRHAQRRSGRRPMELMGEFMRLNCGPGRLTWAEYVQYGVYDLGRYSPDEQARFITNTLHWPITRACCDMTWQATTEDKWLSGRILAGSAIETPATLAVIDRSDRSYPGTRKISTAAQLRAFMTSPGVLPLFGKENRGICSFGAFLAVEADQDGVMLAGQGRLSWDAFMDDFLGATPYLLQELQTNHPFFDRYASALATVRVCILVDDDTVRTPFAVLKLPSPANIADSFWRPGNLACGLDVVSGEVRTVRSRDPFGTTDHQSHPVTGATLLGEVVPMWDQVLDLARRCAPIFQPLRYQSMDIAVTGNGPVLIEINTGGGFDLPQLATGAGFLTDEVRAFFRARGYPKI
jgi:hypothetical protein